MVLVVVFFAVPLFSSVYFAFVDFDGLAADPPFFGVGIGALTTGWMRDPGTMRDFDGVTIDELAGRTVRLAERVRGAS
jgi:ABC-type sugar transport system permease subunit